MKTITFDIMLGERFVCTMRMPLHLWPLTGDEVREFVLSRLPALRGEDFKIEF